MSLFSADRTVSSTKAKVRDGSGVIAPNRKAPFRAFLKTFIDQRLGIGDKLVNGWATAAENPLSSWGWREMAA